MVAMHSDARTYGRTHVLCYFIPAPQKKLIEKAGENRRFGWKSERELDIWLKKREKTGDLIEKSYRRMGIVRRNRKISVCALSIKTWFDLFEILIFLTCKEPILVSMVYSLRFLVPNLLGYVGGQWGWLSLGSCNDNYPCLLLSLRDINYFKTGQKKVMS